MTRRCLFTKPSAVDIINNVMKKICITFRNISIAAIFVAASALSLTSCGKKSKESENTEPPAIEVEEAISDSVVLYETLPGSIMSAGKVNVVARVNGKILAQHFKPGQYVKKGQVLFTIESQTYRNTVERASAQLATARSQHDYYSKQTKAMKKALEADAVSRLQVDQAESNLAQATASIREAEAALSTARENLAHCSVTAPSSGYISAPVYDVGNYVSGEGAAVTLATIVDNANLEAVFSVSDSQYEKLQGTSDSFSNIIYRQIPLKFREKLPNNYTADLYYASPSVDEATGTLLLKGKVNNIDNELKDGMYVTVSLPTGTDPHAVLVKDASIGSDQLGSYMFTVDDSSVVRRTSVVTGNIYQDSLRVIASGIKPGERYVTKALLKVHAGEKIKPVITK